MERPNKPRPYGPITEATVRLFYDATIRQNELYELTELATREENPWSWSRMVSFAEDIGVIRGEPVEAVLRVVFGDAKSYVFQYRPEDKKWYRIRQLN